MKTISIFSKATLVALTVGSLLFAGCHTTERVGRKIVHGTGHVVHRTGEGVEHVGRHIERSIE